MSDIHGNLELLNYRIMQIHNQYPSLNNEYIFLGDYIDGGNESCQVLKQLWDFHKRLPKNVHVLKGNHEQWFLEFLEGKNKSWIDTDKELKTTLSFLGEQQINHIKDVVSNEKYDEAVKLIISYINNTHTEMIDWIRSLPLYYETKHQVFVHAGVDEDYGEYWEYLTDEKVYLNKFPASKGYFYKDIIAGHVSSSILMGDLAYHDIFHDKMSHYYVDGNCNISNNLPVLIFDEDTCKYYSLQVDGTLIDL